MRDLSMEGNAPTIIFLSAMSEFDVVIVEDEAGGYMGFVPALPGCHTQGDAGRASTT